MAFHSQRLTPFSATANSSPPLPPKRPVEPDTPATHTTRSGARAIFRPYPNDDSKITSLRPRVPELSWIGPRYHLLGLHASVPSWVDLQSPRVGRAINYSTSIKAPSGSFEKISLPLAMYPVSPSISFVPPCPGVPHDDYDTPNASASTYTDGGLGAFDPRRVPQYFSSDRPWLGFHDNRTNGEWNEEMCEGFTPTFFFKFHEPGDPCKGGEWMRRRVAVVFSHREIYEQETVRLMAEAAKRGWPTHWFTDSYHMPYYDPLEWSDVLNWRTWIDGRDKFGYTLRYTAEVKAFNRWFTSVCDRATGRNSDEFLPPNQDLMGVWASTISKLEDWLMLRDGQVPIYVITRIPDSHPLMAHLVPGNPDGDERYRGNDFDANHGLPIYWLSRHASELPTIPDLGLQCRPEYIPSSLLPVTPVETPRTHSNSPLYNWHSAVYLDDRVKRITVESLSSLQQQTENRRMLDEIFPVTCSKFCTLRADTDRHPLLDIIGSKSGRDGKLTRYEEEYDPDLDCYYPKRLGRNTPATKFRLETVTYRWPYREDNIEIISDYPFPGRSLLFGRIVGDDEDDGENDTPVVTPPRRYFNVQWSTGQPTSLAFTWEPYVGSGTDSVTGDDRKTVRMRERAPTLSRPLSSIVNQIYVYDDPVYDAVQKEKLREGSSVDIIDQRPPHDLFNDYASQLVAVEKQLDADHELVEWRCRYVIWKESEENNDTPMTTEEVESRAKQLQRAVKQLEMQRERLREQIMRRLFKPLKGDAVISERAVPWLITGGCSTDICYPIRIGGIHGDASNESIFTMLSHLLDILPHEVVIFSSYREVDTSSTIELGMRYCEDALHIRAYLHGVEVDDRLLEVQFLHAMSGQVQALAYPLNPKIEEQRTPLERLIRAVSLNSLPGLAPQLATAAYHLERDLSSEMIEKGQITSAELAQVKITHRKPIQSVLTSAPSLLMLEGREEFHRPLFFTQCVSVGEPTILPPGPDRLLCRYAMTDGMRWEESPKKATRSREGKTWRAEKNTQKHKAIPQEHARLAMSARQRRDLRRAILTRASYLQSCWRPSDLRLPELKLLSEPKDDEQPLLPSMPLSEPEDDTPHLPTSTLSSKHKDNAPGAMPRLYTSLWDWQDECLDVMRQFREATEVAYDFSSFDIAFGGLSRLDSLRGAGYNECVAALAKRVKGLSLSSGST